MSFKYNLILEELEKEWVKNKWTYKLGIHTKAGIRSSQVRALVGYLVEKGILEPDEKNHPRQNSEE